MKRMEITVQVFNSLEETKKILEDQGFKLVETFKLNDWYFSKLNNVENMKFLDLINNSFLVRQVLSDKEEVQICYKKKELDEKENVIAEEKIKVFVNSLPKTLDIFKAAGLNNYCTVKNSTFTYEKGDVHFDVQSIENLGTFIEYEENDTMKNLTEKQKFEKMSSIVNSLGLKLGDDYSCKKVYMMLQKSISKQK